MKVLVGLLLFISSAMAQSSSAVSDPWKAFGFLEGTWKADAHGAGGIHSEGHYLFRRELEGKVFTRHSTNDPGCKEPADYNCAHGDLLYLYPEGGAVKAIYFDNEGHVIHYEVSTPDATTAVFLSEAGRPGPRFRLTYRLKDAVMTGRFEIQMPGQAEWRPFLEWSGARE